MDILTFWELTPEEFFIVANAHYERLRQEAEEKVTLAYMTAYWTARWFSKKKPESLDKILDRKKKPEKRIMTDEEMLEKVKSIHKALGGD